jgi:hypothetical protein
MIALSRPGEEHDGQRRKFNELSYNFLAFSAPMFWMRLLLYLDTFRFFGAMLVVLKVMMKESLIFFALLVIVMVGFLQAFIGMDQVDDDNGKVGFILQAMVNSVMQSPDFTGSKFAPVWDNLILYLHVRCYGRSVLLFHALDTEQTLIICLSPAEHLDCAVQ